MTQSPMTAIAYLNPGMKVPHIEHLQQQIIELKQANSSPDNTDSSKVTHQIIWLETLFHYLNSQVQGNEQLYVPSLNISNPEQFNQTILENVARRRNKPGFFNNPFFGADRLPFYYKVSTKLFSLSSNFGINLC